MRDIDVLIETQAELVAYGRKFDAEIKRLGDLIKPKMSPATLADVLDEYLALLSETTEVSARNTIRLGSVVATPESAPEAIGILTRLAVNRQWIVDRIRAIAADVLKQTKAKPETYSLPNLGNVELN